MHKLEWISRAQGRYMHELEWISRAQGRYMHKLEWNVRAQGQFHAALGMYLPAPASMVAMQRGLIRRQVLVSVRL